MAEPIKIDCHVHVYKDATEGAAAKEGYQIWEYGELPEVDFSRLHGTAEELERSMDETGIAKAVVVNLFLTQQIREAAIAALPNGLKGKERERAVREIEGRLPSELEAFNRWGCEVAKAHPRLVPYVAADAAVMPGEAGARHIREMAERHGARGVKLHCVAQAFNMSDERMWPTYAVCQELGLPIVSHSGPDRGSHGYAEPRAFVGMLEAFPRLRVVLAHLGGGAWRQSRDIARVYPNAYFDCCEIIEWTGGTKAPTKRELAELIKDVGPDRVMMGSDYPWYDLDHQIERVMDLPLLSQEEKEGILGRNAVRILGL
jgi:predicted TIM-barrel fold metal-dependent hydrolase